MGWPSECVYGVIYLAWFNIAHTPSTLELDRARLMDEKKTKAVSKKELLGIYHCYHSNQKGFHKTPAADNLLWSVCPVSLIVSCQILSKSCNVFVASSYLASVSIHYPPECCTFNYCLIGFSDPVDLWVIKIEKPMILWARSTSKLSEQYRARNADHAERTGGRFVYPIVKKTQDFMTIKHSRNSWGSQRFVGFFLNSTFRVMIGWADKLWSRGITSQEILQNEVPSSVL